MVALGALALPLLLLFVVCVYSLGIGKVHVTPLFLLAMMAVGGIQVSRLAEINISKLSVHVGFCCPLPCTLHGQAVLAV